MSATALQASAEIQGRYIFAYRNFRTNQVVYSFKRILKQRDLNAQLPDLGANNKPTQVRLDSWKPFWTVIFPENPAGYYQGKAAYQALRKWRSKREIAGDRPPDLARQHTEEEIEKLRDRLKYRGGSKTETVGDLMKRAKRRLRVRSIMDQKVTSIADLAHVLTAQQRMAGEREEHRQNSLRPAELKALWEYGHNYEENLDKAVTELKQCHVDLQNIYKDHPDQIINTPPVLALRSRIKKLKSRMTAIVFAAKVVLQTKMDYAKEQGYDVGELPNITVEPYLQKASWKEGVSQQADAHTSNPLASVPADILTKEVIEPRLPTHFGTGEKIPLELWSTTSKERQQHIKKHWTPLTDTNGIEIRWEDPLDAEYAQQWPDGIIHRPMGVAKHIANDPEMPPLLTAEDWTERRRVEADLAMLKELELKGDSTTGKRSIPKTVRRNENGLIEHIYREMRVELGLQRATPPDVAEKVVKKRVQPKDHEISNVILEHTKALQRNLDQRPTIETIPIYDAPTATSQSPRV